MEAVILDVWLMLPTMISRTSCSFQYFLRCPIRAVVDLFSKVTTAWKQFSLILLRFSKSLCLPTPSDDVSLGGGDGLSPWG
jgi:hypothetical protein